MKGTHESQADLIDVGTASVETRGPTGIFADEGLRQEKPGLSSD